MLKEAKILVWQLDLAVKGTFLLAHFTYPSIKSSDKKQNVTRGQKSAEKVSRIIWMDLAIKKQNKM